MQQLFLERKALPQPPGYLVWSIHPPPHRCGAHSRHIAGRQQKLSFVGFQFLGGLVGFRPPAKTPFGEPFLHKPVALPIVGEKANGGSTAAAKNNHTTGEWVFEKFFAAELG